MIGGRSRHVRQVSPARSGPESEPVPDPDQAWKALNLVNDWIRHAETKTGATLAAAGVTGGVFYNLVKDQHHPSCRLSVVAVLCCVAIVSAALCATLALVPRLSLKWPFGKGGVAAPPDGETNTEDLSSLLFFAHIARDYKPDDAPTYAQVLKTLSSDRHQLTEQIGRQVHQNAHVARRKYRWSTAAIYALSADLLLLAATAVLVSQHW